MTTGAPPRAQREDLSVECRLIECDHCSGPHVEVRAHGDGPDKRPLFTLTCACSCHQGEAG